MIDGDENLGNYSSRSSLFVLFPFFTGTSVPKSDFSLPQSVADQIGKLILERFSSLMEGHTQHSRRKVLAGIVMTTDAEMERMRIISVSTGTKCVNGEHMSVTGSSLNGQ